MVDLRRVPVIEDRTLFGHFGLGLRAQERVFGAQVHDLLALAMQLSLGVLNILALQRRHQTGAKVIAGCFTGEYPESQRHPE